MVNSAYSEKIKEWLKFSNRDKKWIAHNFCLSDEDVDKWVEDGEAPSREHEETLLQFMNPKVVDLYIYQSWEIAKKILREWRIKEQILIEQMIFLNFCQPEKHITMILNIPLIK